MSAAAPATTVAWTAPATAADWVRLGLSFDAGPEPLVNGHLWSAHAGDPARWPRLTLEARGDGTWAVCSAGAVLARTGDWEYEPLPSSRDEAFRHRCRFGSAAEGMAVAGHLRAAVARWFFATAGKPGDWTDHDEQRIFHALAIAHAAHRGQVRKYGGDRPVPYIAHPEAVADLVGLWLVKLDRTWCRRQALAAAWCHDIVEDCDPIWTAELEAADPEAVALVREVTNPPKEVGVGRAERKRRDRDRLAGASPLAKLIKLCDRLANVTELTGQPAPPDFKALYATESLELLGVLRGLRTGALEADLASAIDRLRRAGEG